MTKTCQISTRFTNLKNKEYVEEDEIGNLDELNRGHRPETVARRHTKTSGDNDTQVYINKFVEICEDNIRHKWKKEILKKAQRFHRFSWP